MCSVTETELAMVWPRASLAEVTVAIKDGTHGTHVRVEDGVPLLSAKNIASDGRVVWDQADSMIRESDYEAICRGYRLAPGDLLLTIVGSLGRRALYAGGKVAFQRSVAFIRSDPAKVAPTYLFHATGHADFQKQLIQRSNATAQAGLYLGELGQTVVPLPPLHDQRRIAAILDTLDEAIRKTQDLISKLKKVRQGLLGDLLTRGIDEGGELRPPHHEAPHLYKDAPFGRIPVVWRVATIDDLATNHDGERIPLKQADRDRRHGVFPYYGASGIIDWIDDFLFDGRYVLLGEDGENIVSRRLPLAFAVSGRFWVNNHAHVLEPKQGVEIAFLTELLEATDFSRVVSGSAQPKLTQEGLQRLHFALPPPREQQRVAHALGVLGDRVRIESAEMGVLRAVKKGLMDDLLTGRVRPNAPEQAPA